MSRKPYAPWLTRWSVVALLGAMPRPTIAGNPPSVELIRREAGAVWDKVTTRGWVAVSDSQTRPEVVNQPDTVGNRHTVRVQWKPPYFRWVSEGVGSGTQPANAMVKNPDYEFKLTRHTAGATDWALKGWKRAGAPVGADYRPIRDDPGAFGMFAHLTIYTYPLHRMLAGDGFTVSPPAVSPANAKWVRLAFTGKLEPREDRTAAVSGWVDLDPAAGWAVREKDMQMAETHTRVNQTMTYTDRSRYDFMLDDDGLPVLRKTETRSTVNGKSPTVATSTLDVRSVAAVNDADFRLTAFGLPEPEGVARSRAVPTYLWVVGAAAVSGGLALVFRRLAAGRAAA